jgi:CubicO group peptidase (beta-lactamase class C family)
MSRACLLALLVVVACKSREEAKAPPVPASAPADAKVARDLAGELEAIRAKSNLPAVAAAVWRDGKLIDSAAVGVRKLGDATKVTVDDAWHLGSNTKAMTAMLVGMYVARGKLRWTDTIAQLFEGQKIDPGYARVTLDQLVRHEGGAPETPPDELWKQLWADGDAPDARAKFVKGILAKPPAQQPGTFVYSNTGYMILGAALEKVAGRPWELLMKDELFGKLDMKSCGFGAPGSKQVVDQPWGHDSGGTPIGPGPAGDNPRGLGPAGTVHCALADYGKFLNVYATGAPALVEPETMQHLSTARSFGYAGGWMVVTNKRGTLLIHSGSNTMWYAIAAVFPVEKLAFAIVTNSGSQALEQSLEAVLARYLEK